MKHFILVLCAICCLHFFAGCIKHYSCEDMGQLSFTADTLLHNGDELQLTAPTGISPNDVQYYNWYGPNQFSEHTQNPLIYNVTAAASGVYHLDILTKGGCTYRMSTAVKVVPQPWECEVAEQSYKQGSSGFSASFSLIVTSLYSPNYRINGSSYYDKVYVEFFGTTPPKGGLYTIRPYSSTLQADEAKVYIIDNSGTEHWNFNAGQVYVREDGNYRWLALCELEGICEETGKHDTWSAKMQAYIPD